MHDFKAKTDWYDMTATHVDTSWQREKMNKDDKGMLFPWWYRTKTTWHIHQRAMRDTVFEEVDLHWLTNCTVLLLFFNWVECLLVCNSSANSSRQGRMWAGKGWVPRKVENMEESCEPPVVKNIHLDLFHVCYLKTMQCGSRGRLKVIKTNYASLLETS